MPGRAFYAIADPKVGRPRRHHARRFVNVHLVDGTYELFRCFYGAPLHKAASGREVGACRGLLRTLIALLKEPDVTHVAVAFDHVIESFRNDLYVYYKTGGGVDPRLKQQFDLAEDVAAALGLVVWPMSEVEADDALATGAARYKSAEGVERVVICSPDKDLCQCVEGERVVTLDRRRKITYDEAGVIGKFGVPPVAIPDYLALVGDAADGIPGIPGWGAKSAGAVLTHYGSVEAIPDDAAAWDEALVVRRAAALADSLRAARDDALLYKQLATLRIDVPLGEALDDLLWRGPVQPDLAKLATYLDDEEPLGWLAG